MKKFSIEWKKTKKYWLQKHGCIFKVHYIRNETEYAFGSYFSAAEAKEILKDFFVKNN